MRRCSRICKAARCCMSLPPRPSPSPRRCALSFGSTPRLSGKTDETAIGRSHITCNNNGIPFDPEKPTVTSGIRLGSPACTTRGFGVAEFRQVGALIAEVLDVLSQNGAEADNLVEAAVRSKVKSLLARFPIYC